MKLAEDVLSIGNQAKVVQSHPIIGKVIRDMREDLTTEEDVVMGNLSLSREERLEKVERIATFRLLLTDFTMKLDGYVQAAENAEAMDGILGE